MQLQYELTQRFTAEYSIRKFLEHNTEPTLKYLEKWADDPSEHVRRLVSEGTRPRLPWASRLRLFQTNPHPVLKLLEHLKDDPSLYVRRSVANNLNDIGKDHPHLLLNICAQWSNSSSPERKWLIRHALRSQIKKGNVDALNLLGYKQNSSVHIQGCMDPLEIAIGDSARITLKLRSLSEDTQNLIVDLAVYFIKSKGNSSRKVFKIRALQLPPKQEITLTKTISFAEKTTRKHYPGPHRMEALVNGTPSFVGTLKVK